MGKWRGTVSTMSKLNYFIHVVTFSVCKHKHKHTQSHILELNTGMFKNDKIGGRMVLLKKNERKISIYKNYEK